ALNNQACEDAALADAVVRAVKAIDPGLILLAPVLSELHKAGERAGLQVAGEIFADRAYTDRATLVPRGQPGAVIHDHDALVTHVLRMLDAGGVVSQSGKVLPTAMDSICVHGDTLGAVDSARRLRAALQARGWTVGTLPEVVGAR
ncbi:MAG: LamB/YcsF family protein, partial [Thauera sp.]|nr:LamB/YcsF family protein [Thauera sp.]